MDGQPHLAKSRSQGYDYSARVVKGLAKREPNGWSLADTGDGIAFQLAQDTSPST